jgi:hypothetical protein
MLADSIKPGRSDGEGLDRSEYERRLENDFPAQWRQGMTLCHWIVTITGL